MTKEQKNESQQPLTLDEQIASIMIKLTDNLPLRDRADALLALAQLRAARTMRDVFASSTQSENPET